MKSSHYYIFWGICTAAVVAGQWYVGSGYRIMAGSVLRLTMGMESVLSSPLR